MTKTTWFLALGLLAAATAFGQQTGSLSGVVVGPDDTALEGVAVTATSDVLPQPRFTTTGRDGEFRLPLLPPGRYEVEFESQGFDLVSRQTDVLLQQRTTLNVTLGLESVAELIEVIGAALIDTSSAELKTGISSEVMDQLPVGQDYRDVVKLIPGVQYSEDSVRGPSAGGSGQDNVYQFDGVNVSLPLFGTLAAEPSAHDIEQVAIVKGGAKALDFNRSGGFTINTISKSGTSDFHGEVGYTLQTDSMTGDRDVESAADFDQDRDWGVVNFGGPLVSDRLFFYTSYYRPTVTFENRSNAYGNPRDFESTRDEFFGKLTFAPTERLLFNASLRDSDRENSGRSVGAFDHPSTSEGDDVAQSIAILEGSFVLGSRGFLSFKGTDYDLETASRPDNLFSIPIRVDGSVLLDIGNLDTQGLFVVPTLLDGEDAYNAFVQGLINQYGYLDGGVANGGGTVGGGSTINQQDFFRQSFEVSYDWSFGDRVAHDFHVGYQNSTDEEDLARLSNGWGVISVPGGRFTTADGTPYFYEARIQQMSIADDATVVDPVIHSEFQSQTIEINDTIRLDNWTFNVGLVAHNDELFGQGLRENSANASGFELAPGNIYKMYEVDWDETLSPRLGAIWAYDGSNTAYVNYARYYPAASSLPRAASWARNLRREIRVRFDAAGNVIEVDPVRSSSGKFFADDLDPRVIDEYLIGTSRQLNSRWTGKAHVRYRHATNFWEDTNNNARSRFEAPAPISQEDYIPELGTYRDEVGGSSYVIAELDGAFTKYYEANLEAEWRGKNSFFRGSYVWSHYYGNFDQDNTTTANDANSFIGSSFIADGAGRQLWNNRYGDLRGDRRHQLKLYGYHNLKWNASVGALAIYQSGQPWEAWDVEVYREFTSSSSDTSRFAESAGSRTTSSHYQLDLNYTQDIPVGSRFNVQLRADVFNVFDNQTGYNIQNKVNSAGFGTARSFYLPRRFQLAVKLSF